MHCITYDIGMRFGIDKCGVLGMHKDKESECEEITIGSGEVISEIDDDGYKYIGIMERSVIFYEEMKATVKTEYFKRV